MANLSVVTAGKIEVVESIEQMTLPAAEAIVAGAPVRQDTTSGRFTNANGTTAPESRAYGIATRSVAAGEAVTAIAQGVLDGFDLSALAFDAAIFLSDTDGRLADAAGTVSVTAGRVIPGTSATLGTAHDKLLRVKLPL
jgi:hypothetical protein